jgi:hypothetical protein
MLKTGDGKEAILDHKNFEENKTTIFFCFIFSLQRTPHDFQLSSKPPMSANKLSLLLTHTISVSTQQGYTTGSKVL